ncbi:MAG: hypothetical protein M3348_06700 [Acidobacteriota bacterium]|nr:hypothetical protein [Acidobacteriota bacterium]
MRRLVLATVGVCCLAFAAAAQEKPGVQPSANLLLQVSRFKDERPQFDSVPCRFWTPIFHRVATSRATKDALPIQAVLVAAKPEGDKVRVSVSLLRGERHPDNEEPVASYLIGVGEEVSARELEGFGVEPYRFAVVKRETPVPVTPAVVNNTQSIEVASVELDFSKAGALRYTLRNLSGKDVAAVRVNTMRNERLWLTGLRLGKEGQALIKPGDVYADTMPVGGQAAPGADGYVPTLPDTLVVASVVFADGTYEGEVETAVTTKAFRTGDKIQLARIVALLREALAAPDLNTPAARARLRARVAALDYGAPASALAEVSNSYPEFVNDTRGVARAGVEVSLNRRKQDFLGALDAFEKAGAASPGVGDFGAWLKGRLEMYETWLARL